MSDDDKSLISDLAKSVKAIAAQQQSLVETVRGLATNNRQQPAEEPKKVTVKSLSKDELESLDRSQFFSYLMENIQATVLNAMTDVKGEVSSVKKKMTQSDVNSQVAQAQRDHDDFNDWVDEIKEKFSQIDGISVEEAYQLARAANPSKAKEIDARLAAEAAKDKDDDPEDKPSDDGNDVPDGKKKGGHGGSPPEKTQGGDGEKDDAKNFKSAADDAWESALEAAGTNRTGLEAEIRGET